MNKRTKIIGLFLTLMLCALSAGCTPLAEKMNSYSSGKEKCALNPDNVTQFFYKSKKYTVLEDTVPADSLGEWVGYIRQLAVTDESGKILIQNDIEKTTIHTLADSADTAPNAAYIIPFLNVYAVPNDASGLFVDVNGTYHKAVYTDSIKENSAVFNFRAAKQSSNKRFKVNPDNATQLLCSGNIYQVTSETVPHNKLGNYLFNLAENITFDANTKKPLTQKELSKIDWFGTENTKREKWFYTGIYEISGTDSAKAVAVKINNQIFLAKAQ